METAIQLPNEVQLLIASLVTMLVTAGLKSISDLLGKDLTGTAAMITAGIVGVIVLFANTLLSAVPPEAQQPVAAAFALLVSLLSAFGLHRTVKHSGTYVKGK